MTEIYCFVDDYLRAHLALLRWRRSPHCAPRFTDSEVITIALLQGPLGVASLKQSHRLVAHNWRAASPCLPTYTQWINRLHQLTRQVGALLEATCGHNSLAARLYLMDSKPIPLCHQLRHGRVRLMREDGAGFGKPSKGWFFDFKLHALRHIAGRVMNIILTPANWDDREPALALNDGTNGGITIADLGYRGPDCAESLAEDAEMLLITRADAPERKFLLSQVRQGVETMFSQW
jgi:transposase